MLSTSIPPGSRDFVTIGLTAGTSTLPETIDQVHRALIWIGRARCVSEDGNPTHDRPTSFHDARPDSIPFQCLEKWLNQMRVPLPATD